MPSGMSSPASSAPGTPTRSGTTSPVLTPKSKVKAMMKAMDSDSDDDDGGDVDVGVLMRKAVEPPRDAEGKPLFNVSLSDDSDSKMASSEISEDEVSEEEEPVRPRGKLAARMMAAHSAKGPAKEPVKGDNAYERVKKSLLEEKREKPAQKEKPEKTPSPPRNEQATEDDSEDLPLTSHRKRTPVKPPNTTSPAPPPGTTSDSDSDNLPANPFGNERFLALVARKREEREAAEAAEAARREARLALVTDDGDDSGDDQALTSQREPTRRRAGKKALEEMHKETQRMARGMQLAHHARTRKKVTKQSLFDKFNFRPLSAVVSVKPVETATVDLVMDVETPVVEIPDAVMEEGMDLDTETTPKGNKAVRVMDGDTTPGATEKGKGKGKSIDIAKLTDKGKGKATRVVDKGKGKAIDATPPKSSPQSKKKQFILPAVRVRLPLPSATAANDSDSDLEIVAPVTPQQERRKMLQSLRAVRRPSPPKMRKAGQLTAKELQADLVQKGRAQAVLEREEQIAELRAKGVIVLTAEERAKENKAVEDLLEKARLESLAIKRMEKKQEKGMKMEAGEDEDDEDDEDWLEGEEEDAGSVLDELSGSEEEAGEEGVVDGFSDEEKEGEEEEEEKEGMGTPVFSLSSMYNREQASPSATPRLSEIPAAYIDDEADDDDSDGGDFAPLKKKPQAKKPQRKKMRVIDEDDDDVMEVEPPKPKVETPKTKIPSIFQRANTSPAIPGMGMTQLFAGTIGASGELQVQDSQDGIALLRRPVEALPNSQMLDFDEPSQDASQLESSKLRLDYSQSQGLVLDYQQQNEQQQDPDVDDMPDPTQDVGFERGLTQNAPPMFELSQDVPESSISTQVLDSQLGVGRRRGRLMRRETEFSDVEEEDEEKEKVQESEPEPEPEEDAGDIAEGVFEIMKKASKKVSKKKREPVDMEKLKADTKGLVEDQAEESEDEYAGIGGASDDDADVGHDSEMEDMMDDTNNETVDENAIAAYYAEKEKVQDEKDVNKLLKDLQSGLLRKKRGAEFDLDDSDDDDDGEARRRAKRRQMAKMRKELLKDGNIEKIASNPKRLAFLSAIEDRDLDDEMDFLDRGEEDLFVELGMVSQSAEASQSLETSQSPEAVEENGEESPVLGLVEQESGSKEGSKEPSREVTPLPVPQSRRPVKNKISSLAHVREQLSFLVEEKETPLDVSDDENEEESQASVMQRLRRTASVIDRVALAREASAVSENTKMAFQTSGTSAGFKVPPLLRRNTSTISTDNESQKSNTSQGTERSHGLAEGAGVKRGGKASSSINFHTREQTRAKIQTDREMKKKLERKKEGQKRQSVLGILAKGNFS